MVMPDTVDVHMTFADLKTGNAEVDERLMEALTTPAKERTDDDSNLIATAIIGSMAADSELQSGELVGFELSQEEQTIMAIVALQHNLDEDPFPIA